MHYLDYASTCPVVKYPQQLYRDVLGKGYFFNPNANYAYKEKRLLSEAENRVKRAIGAKGGKVIFGGTSSQLIENLMNYEFEGRRKFSRFTEYCIGSKYEHDSFDTFLVTRVANIKQFIDALTKNRGFRGCAYWQGVNNITGEVFPIKEIGSICRGFNCFYICDMTAMIGKVPIPANIDQWCDYAVWSGHKLGTELGIGCCWVSDRLDEWLNGFKLHGTPNLAGALAMTQAVKNACDNTNINERNDYYNIQYQGLQDYLINYLIKANIDFQFIPGFNELPSGHGFTATINAIRLPGFNARALQFYLASKEIYIGLGQSSCADEADRRVLCQGYGLSEKEADEVIRISFGTDSSVEDVKALIDGIVAFRKEYL